MSFAHSFAANGAASCDLALGNLMNLWSEPKDYFRYKKAELMRGGGLASACVVRFSSPRLIENVYLAVIGLAAQAGDPEKCSSFMARRRDKMRLL